MLSIRNSSSLLIQDFLFNNRYQPGASYLNGTSFRVACSISQAGYLQNPFQNSTMEILIFFVLIFSLLTSVDTLYIIAQNSQLNPVCMYIHMYRIYHIALLESRLIIDLPQATKKLSHNTIVGMVHPVTRKGNMPNSIIRNFLGI